MASRKRLRVVSEPQLVIQGSEFKHVVLLDHDVTGTVEYKVVFNKIDRGGVILGIAQPDSPLSSQDVTEIFSGNGVIPYFCLNVCSCADTTIEIHVLTQGYHFVDASTFPVGGREGMSMMFRLCNSSVPKISLKLEDDDWKEIKFEAAIPPGNYCPWIAVSPKSSIGLYPTSEVRKKARTCKVESSVLTKMWESRAHVDAVIHCQGQDIQVHRAVLACSSPYFDTLFSGDMKEARSARVEIHDFAPHIVEALVTYLYTEALEPSHALALLPLAHRCQLAPLVQLCAEEVVKNVGKDTVAETLRTLRVLRDDENVSPCWDKVMETLHEDKDLMCVALLRGLGEP
mmetsp:Transcript_82434/g.163572  ORF Transcript_82434/g.163572 Transcript_82434/m.163572 type:complete len:343 (-) Transcript_82434:141-1169(-)